MKYMTSAEIRRMWLDFFASKGHKVEKGASLIPINDPTLLWINSGVAALKKYFDGSEIPPSRRITNAQRSIRTNDIENVGHTARHHTFFEMLGNFSIGDYFRKEVIEYAFEILTSEKYFAFDKDKLYFTYHPTDLETRKYWLGLGVGEDHLIPLEHNFWQIGEGPCGPNTEVFYDRGEKYDPEHLGVRLLAEELENDRYIEIWGIVFSQYNAVEGVARENYQELPSKNIDTGAGLERITCIIQGTETNFETDLFFPIIEEVERMSGKKYHENELAFRVIADHIRACTFANADGAYFSNEGRGYVLRRLLRRAERYGRVLGINKPFLYLLVPVVRKIMEDYYPYLKEKEEFIMKLIKGEEEKFLKTLEVGESLLRKMVEENGSLSGVDMFKLYDTFGFPKELTIEICEELGVSYDLEGFKKEMEAQKERARAARSDSQSMSSQSKDLMEFLTPSKFEYGFKPIKATVIGLFLDGKRVDELSSSGEVVFDITNFYAESGGQVSDIGIIKNDDVEAEVLNVYKAPNKQFLHTVNVLYGSIHEGDEFELAIDEERRLKITRNHSAAHLLQSALSIVLGDHIAQQGSFVSDTHLTFDFSHFAKMSDEEIRKVEEIVNEWIFSAIEGHVEVLKIEEARKLGAKALFNDKYGDVVRVVFFGDVSKEFCGGTHVKNTQDIGLFKIVSEESIAAGIRRITAVTSFGAYKFIKEKEALLAQLSTLLGAGGEKELITRLKALINEKNHLKNVSSALLSVNAKLLSESLLAKFEAFDDGEILCTYLANNNRDNLMAIIDNLKNKKPNSLIILIGDDDTNNPVLVNINGSLLNKYKAGSIVRSVAQALGGSGGGRPDFASGAGKNKDKIDYVIAHIKELI